MSATDGTLPDMRRTRGRLLADGAKAALTTAVDSTTSGGLALLDSVIGRFGEKREARWRRRVEDAARILLSAGVDAAGFAHYVDILGDSDEGIALIEAMAAEMDSEKTWVYAALIGAFSGNEALDREQKVRWLGFCRDATGDEILSLVYRVCKDRHYYPSRAEEETLPGGLDEAVMQTLVRWRLCSYVSRRRELRDAGVLSGDSERDRQISWEAIELAHVLLPFVGDRIAWPMPPETLKDHPAYHANVTHGWGRKR